MKREIICLECYEKFNKLFPNDEPYPNEHIKRVKGKALIDCVCDHCSDLSAILEGDDCYAISMWTDLQGSQYWEWEHEHIKIEE